MSLDVDIIKTRANGDYRLSKVRGECMISVRIPGGIMPAYLLSTAQHIAETFGNGVIHLTTRQKLAMPGIKYQDIPAVNKALAPFIEDITVAPAALMSKIPKRVTRLLVDVILLHAKVVKFAKKPIPIPRD